MNKEEEHQRDRVSEYSDTSCWKFIFSNAFGFTFADIMWDSGPPIIHPNNKSTTLLLLLIIIIIRIASPMNILCSDMSNEDQIN